MPNIDLGTCLVEYLDSGSSSNAGDKPVLLILGGVPSDLRDYDEIVPKLAEKFRVLALQWPGFGKSELKLNATTFGGVQFFHQITLQFMQRVALGKNIVLMGISIGAHVCLRIAHEFPSLVSKLVLVSPIGFAQQQQQMNHHATKMSGKLYPPAGTEAREYLGNKDSSHIKAMLARCNELEEDDEANKVIRSVWRSFLLPETNMARDGALARLRSPVFLVFGKHDNIVDPILHGNVAKSVLGEWVSGFVNLDSRHLPFAEQPQAFLDAVIPFMEENEVWL